MRFRPCIDIHDGVVKQIVGGSLTDSGKDTAENYVSSHGADYYANIYKEHNLKGGHIAMLNKSGTEQYEATRQQACKALDTFRGGLQIGGGINADNAADFIEHGASHVIVTSYAFFDGEVNYDRLDKLRSAVGKEHVVLDLSCRRRDDGFYIVTDRWQKFTKHKLEDEVFERLYEYCDEFLVHAVDVEGKKSGIDEEVVGILARQPYVITYAGGISEYSDIELIKRLGNGCIDITIGSALSLFGGRMDFEEVIACIQ